MALPHSRVALLVAVAFLSGPAAANSEGILLDFRDRPLAEIVEHVARATHTAVIIDSELKGSATLALPRRVSSDEALMILESALLLGGYALLPATGGVRKILPIPDALPGAPVTTAESLERRDGIAATLLSLEWTAADEIASKIQHLVARQDIVVPYPETNSLILVGRESRLARLIGIAKLLDQEQGEMKLWVRALRYRSADDVASLLRAALDRPGADGRASVYDDPRTHRLIVMANEHEMTLIQDFVTRIDAPRAFNGDLEILPVLYRDPEELATLLRTLATEPSSGNSARRTTGGETLRGRDFSVEADVRTRSLLVHGDVETRERIREVVELLDLPPRQVLLELAFVEISKPQSFKMSFDFFLPLTRPNSADDVVGSLFSNPSGGGLRSPDAENLDFLFGRVGREPLLLTVTDPATGQPVDIIVPREQLVFGAEDSNVTTKLKSRPSLVVVTGEEHSLTIGNNIPIPVSSSSASAIGSQTLSTVQNIERYDTGVHVRVRPTIGEAGMIHLDVYLKLDELTENSTGDVSQVGPELAQRQAEATIILRPGEIAVLGMAQDQAVAEQVNKAPWLGDIPFVGIFFRAERREIRDRQILMTVQAQTVGSPSEMQEESIRLRLSIERSLARHAPLSTEGAKPFTARVASLTSERGARELVARLSSLGFATYWADWTWEAITHYDVYVGSHSNVFDLIAEARRLEEAGFPSELVITDDGFGPTEFIANSQRANRAALQP